MGTAKNGLADIFKNLLIEPIVARQERCNFGEERPF